MLRGSVLRKLVTVAGIAVLPALYVRTFVLLPLHVPTESMVPAVLPGDHVLVDRLAYVDVGILPRRHPRRGDVVVLRSPRPPHPLLVKRCVGLPGDRIERRGGVLLVDGRAIDASWATNGATNRASNPAADGPRGDFPPVRLGAREIFLLGDQPGRSVDSRRWGAVDENRLVGRAVLVYWSMAPASGHPAGWDRIIEPIR